MISVRKTAPAPGAGNPPPGHAMKQEKTQLLDFFVPEKKYLKRLTARINDAVVLQQKEFMTDRMGTTMVTLFFSGRQVYVCNVGDSRAYHKPLFSLKYTAFCS